MPNSPTTVEYLVMGLLCMGWLAFCRNVMHLDAMQPYPVAAYPGNGAAYATLYEGHDFQGRQFPMTREVMNNLDRTGFNDRAGSLRVTSGYWVFCSDANFQGDCRTFGPGEYPNLERELDRRISSGRLISNAYPYSGQPQWERRF